MAQTATCIPVLSPQEERIEKGIALGLVSEEAQKKNVSSPGQTQGREAMTKKYFTAPPTPSGFEVISVVE